MDDASKRRSWIRSTLWIGLACAALLLWFNVSQRVRLVDPRHAPPATSLQVRALDGTEFELGDYRGRVLIVNLWASWCGPCRAEVPRLSRLERDLKAQGLTVFGLNAEGFARERLRRIGEDLGIAYGSLIPLELLGGTTFEGRGVVPHTWMIDRQGRVRASRAGLISEASLRKAARQLLDEPVTSTGYRP